MNLWRKAGAAFATLALLTCGLSITPPVQVEAQQLGGSFQDNPNTTPWVTHLTSGDVNNTTSPTTSLNDVIIPAYDNDLVLVSVTHNSAASNEANFTSGWALVQSTTTTGATTNTTDVYRRLVNGASSLTFNVTFTTPVTASMAATETNVSTTDGKVGLANPAATIISSGTLTPTATGDLAIYTGGYTGTAPATQAQTCAAQSGWTALENNVGPSGGYVGASSVGLDVQSLIVTGTPATTGNCTLANARDGTGLLLLFKPALNAPLPLNNTNTGPWIENNSTGAITSVGPVSLVSDGGITPTFENDTILAVVIYNGAASVLPTVPTGWTLSDTTTTSGTPNITENIYRQVAAGPSALSLPLTFTTPVMVVVTTLETNTGLLDVKGAAALLASGAITSPAETPTVSSDLAIFTAGYGGTAVSTQAPACAVQSGWTSINNNRGNSSSAQNPVADENSYLLLPSSGLPVTTGTCTFTSPATADGVGHLVLFKPTLNATVAPSTPMPTPTASPTPTATSTATATPTNAPTSNATPPTAPTPPPAPTDNPASSPVVFNNLSGAITSPTLASSITDTITPIYDNDLMFVNVTYGGNVQSGLSSGWTLVQKTTTADNSLTTAVYREAVAGQTSMTFGLTFGSAVPLVITALETNVSGVDIKGALANATATTLTSPAETPPTAGDLALFMGGYAGTFNASFAPTCTTQPGWTPIQNNKGPSAGFTGNPNVATESAFLQLTGSPATTGVCTYAVGQSTEGVGNVVLLQPTLNGPYVAPTATPTAAPTATPTAAPTATPTAAPTATPTAAPTATPTAAPTATPTVAPTATASSAPLNYCYVDVVGGSNYGYTQGQEVQYLPGGLANSLFQKFDQPCNGSFATPNPSASPGQTAAPVATATPYAINIAGTVNSVQSVGISTLAFVPQVYGGGAPSFSNPAPLSNSYPTSSLGATTNGIEFWLGAGSGTGGDPGPDCVQLVYWNVGYYGPVPTNLNALGSVVAPQICGPLVANPVSAFAPVTRTVVSIAPAQGWNLYVVGINISAATGGPRWRAVQ